MRHRKTSYRYSEIVDGVPLAFSIESWDMPQRSAVASPFFRPAADVVETSEDFVVVLEVAGVAEDEVEVCVHPDVLVVSGRRRCPEVEGARYHAAEIRYGPFRFEMALPTGIDRQSVVASTDRGLVRILMKKRDGGNP